MITVKLIGPPAQSITDTMSHAARTCYEREKPAWGKKINIQERVFNPGHHSILQHINFTFFIEGIAISNVTFGLHLNAPFYTSSQRSGRFCSGMFSDPDVTEGIIKYIKYFFPQTSSAAINDIQHYINYCKQLYHQNIDPATQIAEGFIAQERLRASDKYVKQNAPKFAQEQLRVLIPTIFPTGLSFTINLSTLVALYRSAWDPVMEHLTYLMASEVLAIEPALEYMFQRDGLVDLSPLDLTTIKPRKCHLEHKPKLQLISMDSLNTAIYPTALDMHPVDMLHFDSQFMPNDVIDIATKVIVSLITMGQDQRHRQIRRGPFQFTGGFYCPPIVRELNIDKQLLQASDMWLSLSGTVHPALLRSLAPYGEMVTYGKKGSLNATLHEQYKRLCWCTQQEIYDLSLLLREAVAEHPNCTPEFLNLLSPPCFQNGLCGEGKRYCGRDITVSSTDFFPARNI